MSKMLDLCGRTFGRLYVKSFSHTDKGRSYWECTCSCGNTCTKKGNDLTSNSTMSCGCFYKESRLMHEKHGMSSSRLYKIWKSMKKRCNNETETGYVNYGGRGITYDTKWETFEGFYEDMASGYEDFLTLERSDVNGNYEKGNCVWIGKEAQARNRTMMESNSSGITGVHKATVGKFEYWIAQWNNLSGKRCAKSFKVEKYGEELAFFMACEYRDQMINLLNLQGAGYSENHGKPKITREV